MERFLQLISDIRAINSVKNLKPQKIWEIFRLLSLNF